VASVNVYSSAKVNELTDGAVVGASLAGDHLVLTLRDGSTIDVGAVLTALIYATTTTAGAVELATDTEAIAGTSADLAITPLSLAAVVATATAKGLVELATTSEATTGTDTVRAVTPAGLKAMTDTKQPLDSDLTAIAALTGTNDNVIQRKSGAWTERTMAQVATDLAATGEFPDLMLYNGSAYADADGGKVYIGAVDPGAVSNGSVWFDTTGT
jgi:hypothetical protein